MEVIKNLYGQIRDSSMGDVKSPGHSREGRPQRVRGTSTSRCISSALLCLVRAAHGQRPHSDKSELGCDRHPVESAVWNGSVCEVMSLGQLDRRGRQTVCKRQVTGGNRRCV